MRAWPVSTTLLWRITVSLSAETLQTLRGLIEKDPVLLAQLQQTREAALGAALLTRVAQQAGISVDTEQLHAYLESSLQQADAALSDAQLDLVAGGMNKAEFIAASIFSLGIVCIAMSAERIGILKGRHMYDPSFSWSNHKNVGINAETCADS